MKCRHVLIPITLVGAINPEFYVCQYCGMKVEPEQLKKFPNITEMERKWKQDSQK